MRLSRLNAIGGFFLAAMLSAPMWGANPALPGSLNYVEGQAQLGTEVLNAKSVGSVTLESGQTLTTQAGKAEILLTPGVFFRVGENSTATMISPSLTNTEVGLDKGTALVEVAELHKANLLEVKEGDSATQLLKTGLYAFDADQGAVRVLKGEALVQDGDQRVTVKGGHELDLNANGKLKTQKFNKDTVEQSDLYRFSSLRSEYLAEANVNAAQMYIGGYGWYGPGWYWDPWFWSYTWIPGAGMFYSPFGWGFYSPALVWRAPGFYPGYYHGYGPYRGGVLPAAHGGSIPHATGTSRTMAGGEHFGVMGGGFHGGGGGFHH